VDARVQTRLGDGSIDIDVQGALVSPFTGAGIERLAIRATWLRNATPGSPARVVGYDKARQRHGPHAPRCGWGRTRLWHRRVGANLTRPQSRRGVVFAICVLLAVTVILAVEVTWLVRC